MPSSPRAHRRRPLRAAVGLSVLVAATAVTAAIAPSAPAQPPAPSPTEPETGQPATGQPATGQPEASQPHRPWFEHARVDLEALGDARADDDGAGVEATAPEPGWSVEAALPIPGQFVVLEWDGDPHAGFRIRSRNDGEWTDWVDAHVSGDERPDASEPGVEGNSVGPIFIGDGAEAVDIEVEEGRPDGLSLLVMESHEPAGYVEPTVADVGGTPGALPGSGDDPTGRAEGAPSAPAMFTASQWGSGGWAYANSGCGSGPTTMSALRFAVVHHTVSTNDYTSSQADDQIRAIYDYHVNGRGWCDIAYNFVVDRFGTVWEGRTGSIGGPVQGGHASGFNTGSMGVVLLGQYHPGSSPPAATVSSSQYNGVRDLIAWKFGQHDVDALGTTVEVSGGSTSIPAGTKVTLKTISGHRDVGSTGCPGDNAYTLLPNWRTDVAARVAGAPTAATRPAAGRNADGRLEVFALGGSSKIFHGWQSKPNAGPWTGWYELGSSKFTAGVAVTSNKDGRLQLFARNANGQISTSGQTTPNGIWSSFSSIGGSARGAPAAGTNKDGRLEAYYTGNDGAVWHNWQWSPGGSWSGWFSMGGSFTAAPTIGTNKDGRQEIAVVSPGGQLVHSWQQVPNGGWSPWYSLGGSLKGDAAAATNKDGRMEMFALGTDGQLWHNWQWVPNGTTGWSGWYPMGGSFTAGPAININIDGRLELFIYGPDGRLWNNWQVVPNGGWSGWHPLSSALR